MSEVVYIDVLVVINIIVTYLLLAGSAFFSAVQTKQWRLLLSSLLGGASSLLIFLPASPWWLLAPIKVLSGAALVWAAFGYGGRRRFLRCFAAFFAVNFAFAGIMLALWLTLQPNGMFYQNGAVYFDVNMITLVLFACVCYGLMRGLVALLRRRHPGANAFQATIHMPGRSITLPALYDSGNALTDGFTGAPVIVAEFAALQGFVPESLHPFFTGEESLALLPEEDPWRSRLREIPFHALGMEGLLPAFRSDQVVVKPNGTAPPKDKKNQPHTSATQQAIIAVTTESLSDGSYSVILQKSMLEK